MKSWRKRETKKVRRRRRRAHKTAIKTARYCPWLVVSTELWMSILEFCTHADIKQCAFTANQSHMLPIAARRLAKQHKICLCSKCESIKGCPLRLNEPRGLHNCWTHIVESMGPAMWKKINLCNDNI